MTDITSKSKNTVAVNIGETCFHHKHITQLPVMHFFMQMAKVV